MRQGEPSRGRSRAATAAGPAGPANVARVARVARVAGVAGAAGLLLTFSALPWYAAFLARLE